VGLICYICDFSSYWQLAGLQNEKDKSLLKALNVCKEELRLHTMLQELVMHPLSGFKMLMKTKMRTSPRLKGSYM
jgi:hypothetical protein